MFGNRILTDRIQGPPHYRNRIRIDRIAPSRMLLSRIGRNRMKGKPHGVHRITLRPHQRVVPLMARQIVPCVTP